MGGLEVASLFATVGADVSDFSKGMDKVKADLSFAEKGLGGLQNTAKVAFAAIGTAAVAGFAAVATGLTHAVNAAADVEQQAANISAVFGNMAPPIEEVKGLINTLALDPSLVVGVEDAGAGLQMLAQNGLTWQQIADGAARSSILLSNATGADLATSADIATNAMGIFGLEVTDLDSVVATFVNSANKSQFGVEDWGQALSNAGPKAAAMGFKLEELFAAMTLTSSGFSSGMMMGTSWAWMINGLTPSTQKATDVMKALGLITADGANQFFNADGTGKGLTEVIKLLQGAFGDLTTEQQMTISETLFGSEAFGALSGVLGLNNDELNKLIPGMVDFSAVEAGAETRTNTFAAATAALSDTINSVFVMIGDKLLPVVTSMARNFADFVKDVAPTVVEWAGNFATTLETTVGWLAETVKTGDLFNESFSAMPQPIQDVITNLTNMITAVTNFITPIVEAIDKVVDWQDVLNAVVVVIASIVIPAIVSFLAAAAPILVTFAALVAASALLRTAWDNDWGGIQTKTKVVFSYLTDTFGDLFATIRDFGGESLGEIIKWATGQETEFSATNKIWETARETFGKVFTDIGDKLTEWGELAWKWFKENFPQAAEALTTAFDSISTNFKELWDALKPLIDAVVEAFNGLVEDWTTGSGDMSGALQAAKTIMDGIWAIMVTVVTTSINTMINVLTLVAQLLSGDWSGAWTTAQQIVSDVVGAVGSIVETTLTTVGGLFGISKADIKTWYDDTKKNIGDWWTSFSTNIAERDWDGIAEDLMQVFDATGIKDWYTKTTQNIKDWWDTVKTYIVDKDWFKYGSAIIGGLLDGVKDKWKEFTDWTGTTFQGWIDWFDGLFQFGSPSKLMKQRGQWLMEGLSDGIAAAAIMPIDAMDALATAVQGKVDSMVTAVTNSAKTIRDVYNNMPALPEGYWSTPTTPTTTPVVTPAPTPTTPTTPNQVYTGGAGAGSAVGMGEKKVSWGLNMLATLVDTGDTVQDIIDFANQAKSFLTGNGATPLQGSSAENLALRSLTSGGIDSLSVNNLIGQIQTLVSALTRKDGARAEQAFNISVLAPDASLTTQQQLEELVSYLNALYG